MKIHRVLVTTDFSSLADQAIAPASELVLGATGGCLILAHVIGGQRLAKPDPDAPHFQAASNLYEVDLEQERDALLKIEERLKAYEGLTWRAVVGRGEPIESIIDIAAREKADLIVISSQGRTGLSRLILGSVAEELARVSPLPVLIWKQPQD
ncbi:MAG: universal stress protein [Planctomycetes bacterium]|nr:universal stress protein [Planctomycetota bacterium]